VEVEGGRGWWVLKMMRIEGEEGGNQTGLALR
jgi:hypothetical protein